MGKRFKIIWVEGCAVMVADRELFKVVWVDGYNRETIAERAVKENLSRPEAVAACNELRNASKDNSDWWVVKPQSYELWRGMAEFVD